MNARVIVGFVLACLGILGSAIWADSAPYGLNVLLSLPWIAGTIVLMAFVRLRMVPSLLLAAIGLAALCLTAIVAPSWLWETICACGGVSIMLVGLASMLVGLVGGLKASESMPR
jgi:hypothetical protein